MVWKTTGDIPADTMLNLDGLADGEYEVRVRAKDDLGNYSHWSPTKEIEVEAIPVVVPNTQLVNCYRWCPSTIRCKIG